MKHLIVVYGQKRLPRRFSVGANELFSFDLPYIYSSYDDSSFKGTNSCHNESSSYLCIQWYNIKHTAWFSFFSVAFSPSLIFFLSLPVLFFLLYSCILQRCYNLSSLFSRTSRYIYIVSAHSYALHHFRGFVRSLYTHAGKERDSLD